MNRISRTFRISFHPARLGLPIALLSISLVLGQVVDHAYVAAWPMGLVIALGVCWPILATSLADRRISDVPTRGVVGQSIEVEVTSRLMLPLPLPGMRLRDRDGRFGASTDFTLHPGRRVQRLTVTPLKRGTLKWNEAEIVCDFPFGVVTAARCISGRERTVVWPIGIEIDLPASPNSAPSAEPDWHALHAGDGEPAGVRPYRRGDAVRLIHWRQSARHDRLIVREREAMRSQLVYLALDTRKSSYVDPLDFERAVSIVAGAMRAALDRGQRTRLFAGPTTADVIDEQSYTVAMDMLADVQWCDRPMDFPAAAVVITSQKRLTTGDHATLHRTVCIERLAEDAT